MYDNDMYNILNSSSSTSTETEEQVGFNQSSTGYQTSQDYSYGVQEETPYRDDYSVTPNYEEQQSYQTNTTNVVEESTEQDVRFMAAPVIKKQEQEAVVLTKTVQKIQFSARMKLVASMFAVIMVSLIFAIVWNFVSANKINATIAEKQIIAQELELSIKNLTDEYNFVSGEEQIADRAEQAGFVQSDDTNTVHVELGEMFEEQVVKDLPSNWFNDICNFFSNLFS